MHISVKNDYAHSAFASSNAEMHTTHMNNLAHFRKLRGLSQTDLGELIGKDQSTIARAEKESPTAKLITYKECAKALGITLAQVFGDARTELEIELLSVLERHGGDLSPAVRSALSKVEAQLQTDDQ